MYSIYEYEIMGEQIKHRTKLYNREWDWKRPGEKLWQIDTKYASHLTYPIIERKPKKSFSEKV